ncbi:MULTISPECIES: hypothetical protein [Burkholderia]|uniref:Uncharacterized protein n=1 Tax=Burkholderia multivorans CGD2 TaxID=513052 RepID=B9BKL8_9BURK|nr:MULTISPECIES: hypothetical protein [Burkholderia]EEE08485.1 hypothetical protein BURMUCGD2_5626 [Burkholderia multivorans CGD2]EEE16172.1 hypothetical protein BURMUCGD2M_5617 [Burkholderia multivorans CGD2M]MBH9660351.1 hypothetical protein [Burkholderia multivorans]MBJ9685261.1 hypothetical protein [Burkholderia multivorans]MBU9248366.1 hypothetical protein [Burkholderia multivorans]
MNRSYEPVRVIGMRAPNLIAEFRCSSYRIAYVVDTPVPSTIADDSSLIPLLR